MSKDKPMTREYIKSRLCWSDFRNPDFTKPYGYTDEELKEEGYGNHPRKNCYCDNCYHRIAELAEELLKYVKE